MADWHEKGNKCDMMDGVSYHTYYGFAIVGWEERVDGILGMIFLSHLTICYI